MPHDPITAGISLVQTFIGKFVKDKDLAEKLSADLNSQKFAGDLSLLTGQLEINKVEAAHESMFVAGWRPYVGWICGTGVAIKFIVMPLAQFIVILIMDKPPEFPEFNIAELLTLLGGMLGFGALRTFEKLKGVAREK